MICTKYSPTNVTVIKEIESKSWNKMRMKKMKLIIPDPFVPIGSKYIELKRCKAKLCLKTPSQNVVLQVNCYLLEPTTISIKLQANPRPINCSI